MQVIAISLGFYGGVRRYTGDIFEMEERFIKEKDGKKVMPSWVKAAPDPTAAKKQVEALKKAEANKVRDGIIASSGGDAAKKKAEAMLAESLAG